MPPPSLTGNAASRFGWEARAITTVCFSVAGESTCCTAAVSERYCAGLLFYKATSNANEAQRHPRLIETKMVASHTGRIALSQSAQVNQYVEMHGLLSSSGVPPLEIDRQLKAMGVQRPDERQLARAAIEKL